MRLREKLVPVRIHATNGVGVPFQRCTYRFKYHDRKLQVAGIVPDKLPDKLFLLPEGRATLWVRSDRAWNGTRELLIATGTTLSRIEIRLER